ncbi:MAG: hypothetical protein IPH59_00225 [bacterium]|nr:hypothetical protein [bacterium]
MQAYFDRDDADLELNSMTEKTPSPVDSPGGFLSTTRDRRNIVSTATSLGGLAVVIMLLVSYFGSLPFKAQAAKLAPDEFDAKFVIELPKPKPDKPKPKFKPVVKPPETKPVERLRSIPDKTTQVLQKQTQLTGRAVTRDAQRVSQQEAATERSLPATIAPAIAPTDEFAQRDFVQEQTDRSTTVALTTDRSRDLVGAPSSRTNRVVAEAGVSRVKLDPYHYQMVNICLRQCVRTMFTHAGLDETEKAGSKEWLKVTRSGGNYFDFRFSGKWHRLQVNVNLLGDISNIDFVGVPAIGDDAESLLEDATRKLCRLLRFDDCFAKL